MMPPLKCDNCGARPAITELADEAMARFNALTPEQQAAHREAQRQSFIRGMTTPCEHGVLDFEQCGECRNDHR